MDLHGSKSGESKSVGCLAPQEGVRKCGFICTSTHFDLLVFPSIGSLIAERRR